MQTPEGINVYRRIHYGWKEWKNMSKELKDELTFTGKESLFGKWQYIYESKKGAISLVRGKFSINMNKYVWEIYCFEGELFNDVERFRTKKEAEERIFNLLK